VRKAKPGNDTRPVDEHLPHRWEAAHDRHVAEAGEAVCRRADMTPEEYQRRGNAADALVP
jgi:hypothetical protein